MYDHKTSNEIKRIVKKENASNVGLQLSSSVLTMRPKRETSHKSNFKYLL